MEKKKRTVIGILFAGIIVLAAVVFLPQSHTEKKQAELFLKPLCREARELSFSVREVTRQRDLSFSKELDAVKRQFDVFAETARKTENMTESEIKGFDRFENALGYCGSRIRVIWEADREGKCMVPDEVLFLDTLDESLCVLTDRLQEENGGLAVSNAEQYSEILSEFSGSIGNAGRR